MNFSPLLRSKEMPTQTPAPRPPIAAEVRAWGAAAIAVFAHTVGIVWWAATLSADFKALKDLLVAQQSQYNDHEQRLRGLEMRNARKDNP